MTDKSKTVVTLLSELDDILYKERQALQKYSFDNLTEITERKTAILSQLEAANALLENTRSARTATAALRSIQASAGDNMKKLRSFIIGAQRAQRRITAVAKRERAVGAYGADGAPLGNIDRSSVASSA